MDLLSSHDSDKVTLEKWARAGILLPQIGYPNENIKRWYYDPDIISAFPKSYITTNQAAEIIGYSARTISSWVNQGWLPAASDPAIDGARTYRFDKNAILRWRTEYMVSSEDKAYLNIAQRTFESWIAKGILVPVKNMSQHPYWFLRTAVEELHFSRDT